MPTPPIIRQDERGRWWADYLHCRRGPWGTQEAAQAAWQVMAEAAMKPRGGRILRNDQVRDILLAMPEMEGMVDAAPDPDYRPPLPRCGGGA